jgi:cysteine synthase
MITIANRAAHYESTGPLKYGNKHEGKEQRILVCTAGTGGKLLPTLKRLRLTPLSR